MVNVSHSVVGRGPTRVIALHGWFGPAGWGFLPSVLDPQAYTYAFMDLRGYGGRIDEAGDHTLEAASADVQALADELGWDTFALLGHLMGGAAALRAYADVPERVTAFVGISPVPASGVPFDEQTRAVFDAAGASHENRRGIVDQTTGNRLSAHWLDALAHGSTVEASDETVSQYLTAWADADFAAQLPTPTIPVKAIVGEHDPAISADFARATWLQQLPGCELDVLANAGHYSMFETPVALITSVEGTLSTIA